MAPLTSQPQLTAVDAGSLRNQLLGSSASQIVCRCQLKPETLTFAANILFEVTDLAQSRILSAGAQQITETVKGDAAVAAFIEQGKCLLVVRGSLSVKVVRSHAETLDIKRLRKRARKSRSDLWRCRGGRMNNAIQVALQKAFLQSPSLCSRAVAPRLKSLSCIEH